MGFGPTKGETCSFWHHFALYTLQVIPNLEALRGVTVVCGEMRRGIDIYKHLADSRVFLHMRRIV